MPHKTCSYGDCKSDSRKRGLKCMEGVFFLPFPKPVRQYLTCKRWAKACGRADFTVDSVTRHSYVCSMHFVGGKGPTSAHPDPIPFTAGTFTTSHTGRRVVIPFDGTQQTEGMLADFSDETESQSQTERVPSPPPPPPPPQVVRYVYSDLVPEQPGGLGELPSVYVRSDHCSRLHQHLIQQWQMGSLCDAALVVRGNKLPFHRLVLMAVSNFVSQTLAQQSSSTRVEFQMPDSVEVEASNSFLHYLYHGILNVSVANARSVHTIATILQVPEVQQHCQNFVSAVAERLGIPAAQITPPSFDFSIQTVPDGKEDACADISQDRSVFATKPALGVRRKPYRPLSSLLQRRYGQLGGGFGGVSSSLVHRRRFSGYSSSAVKTQAAADSHAMGQFDLSVLQNIKLESVEGEEADSTSATLRPSDAPTDSTSSVAELASSSMETGACDLGLPFSID